MFVRQTAKLCLRALVHERPEHLLFEDLADVAAKAPHEPSVATSRLIGESLLALNLNEYGCPSAREAFGIETRLPACLAASRDRREILMFESRETDCPFAKYQPGGCLCPYIYDPPDSGNRRELSQAFCRHQRLHAKRLPWQSEIGVRELKRFWRGMEDLARF
ncbi:MAG: hypothetical protein ACLP0J_05320 [Solirubrobacteraceae bacterium]